MTFLINHVNNRHHHYCLDIDYFLIIAIIDQIDRLLSPTVLGFFFYKNVILKLLSIIENILLIDTQRYIDASILNIQY